MFVLKSKYDLVNQELSESVSFLRKALVLINEKNREILRLTTKVSDLELKKETSAFTQEEIQAMIRLCHPDKHNNSDTANNITKKLLSVRNK